MMKHANISLFVPHAGCPHQCSFCNQKTISGSVRELKPSDVTETLTKARLDMLSPENTEIAFFGGSFTAIERGYMISLLEAAKPFIDDGSFCGIRISTRPDAIDRDVLEILKKYRVNSIELGAQSTDDYVLIKNRRGHTREDIFNSSRLIKEYGFSLGLQMMTGLYGDTDEKTVRTAEDIISLHPDTVRIYPTIVLENTQLGELYKSGVYRPQTVEEAAQLCAKLLVMFRQADITVIRLGLHSGGNVEEGYLAGPYHPAFGEICESKIYYGMIKKQLDAAFGTESVSVCSLNKKEKVSVYVNPSDVSKAIGQKGANRIALLRDGYEITVKGLPYLKKGEIHIDF